MLLYERPDLSCLNSISINPSKKCQTKIAADNYLILYFYLSKKIRLDFSCESSA